MQRPDIPFSFLATQSCRNCQMPVSCGPVYVVNDLSILCGRCKKYATDHYRNYSYEALGSIFFYPCENWRNHCPMKLRWNESLEHENECQYIGCCTFFFSHPGAFFKGKRDIPRDEIKLVLIPEDLLEYIKCGLCEGYLNHGPVFLQSSGQNVCHRCVHANGDPPNCRRNYAYEELSKMFIFPCTYKNRGCPERMPFGMQLWQHESECNYGTLYKKKGSPERNTSPVTHSPTDLSRSADPVRPSKQKEKGLIKTQTGHIWATITPNHNVTKQLVQSIAKKQQRNIRRADEIGNEMGSRNSDSESVATSDSFSLKNSQISYSGNSTPDPLDPSGRSALQAPYIPTEDYNGRSVPTGNRPDSRESGYHNGYQDDLESNSGSARTSIRPTYQEPPVAGNFPVLMPHRLNDGFDSIGKRYSHREDYRGNTQLINELKIKQDIIKRTHSIKGDQDTKSPYRINNNNNLGALRETDGVR